MKTKFGIFCLAMSMAAVLAACGDGSQAPAGDARQSSGESDETPSHVCGLLSREQVDTVIPGNDGGRDRDTSEAALLKDVGMEHCSYLHVEGTDIQFLDVIIYRASSDEGFEQIDIGDRAQNGSVRKLDIGDISFLDNIDSSTIKVSASKGRTVFELSLNSTDAPAKSDQLIELARVVVGKQ
jgi:hypothetical protein